MSDHQHEPVGSLADELARLMGTLSDLSETPVPGAEHDDEPPVGAPGDGAHAHARVAAGDAAACAWCPVCQVIAFVDATSPEVRAHLSTSAASLAAAARGLVAAVAAHQAGSRPADDTRTEGHRSGVEDIDLTEDSWD